MPALLAQAAVHHALVDRGLRMRASIVVETGDARDAHQLGLLFGYGASAVCPSLGYDTIAALADAIPPAAMSPSRAIGSRSSAACGR